MLEQICAFIHNYFLTDSSGNAYGRHEGPFPIVDGGITLDGYEDGDYFLVRGSRRNDGVYMYPATDMQGDTLDGVVWEMRPPKAFLDLVSKISDWNDKYGEAVQSPYQSESFNGYSYTKAGAGTSGGADVSATGWAGVFKAQLNQWRKLA